MVVQATLLPNEVYSPVGVDLTRTHTTAQFKLGTVAKLQNGGTAIYCLSSGSIAMGALVAIDSRFVARGCTTAIAKTNGGPGWPQVAMADGTYGWVQTSGSNMVGKQKDGTAANAQLYTSTSVGIMGTDPSTGAPVMIAGVRNIVLSSGAGAAYEIMAVNPHFILSSGALIT